ncbi:hypothetical protein HHK36_024267 [Tetracentron sinense]|uniref:Ubiquitin-like domain-containing protein n=1 Tax=Tetracentron sinense TaxID=13715 RepID=A0A835D3Z4_TETSI|nr:hypothetical protein HHK36_024267 [Tetracentron sinense]
MTGVQDQLEIKFRLTDGSDIGPKSFPAATSVATLKENILAQWPEEKDNGPRTVKDMKIISAGKILENNRTLGECRSPICDIPGAVTTMHVVVQPNSSQRDEVLELVYTSNLVNREDHREAVGVMHAHSSTAHVSTKLIRPPIYAFISKAYVEIMCFYLNIITVAIQTYDTNYTIAVT